VLVDFHKTSITPSRQRSHFKTVRGLMVGVEVPVVVVADVVVAEGKKPQTVAISLNKFHCGFKRSAYLAYQLLPLYFMA